MSPCLSSCPPMTISEPALRFDAGNCAGDGVSGLAAARLSGRFRAAWRLALFATEHRFTIRAVEELGACDDAAVAHQDPASRNRVNGCERAGPQRVQIRVGTAAIRPLDSSFRTEAVSW
jgi:hypothetical protein